MKKQFINDIKAGDRVDDIFILSEKNVAQKKDGNNYLHISLSDKTGTIKGVVWDNLESIMNKIASGDIVHIHGNVSEYKGDPQLVVKKMEARAPDTVDLSDFLPTTGRDTNSMFERLLKRTGILEKVYFKELLEAFWNDEEFVRKFKTAPAAKKMHHGYLGGLLEHTLSLALLAERIAGHYSGIDMDLLVTGAVLHDIGKIREFDYKTTIEYSDEGRLLNHIVIGTQMVDEKLKKIKEFPAEQALLLKHMIVSHHGIREFGSPEPPKTIEAVLLNYLDEIDSKVNGIREFMSSEDSTETWTSYHRLLERHFYKGKT